MEAAAVDNKLSGSSEGGSRVIAAVAVKVSSEGTGRRAVLLETSQLWRNGGR